MKFIIYIVSLIVLVLLTPNKFETFSPGYNIVLSTIYIILLIYFLNSQRKFYKNWVRFDVIFLIGYTIVHYQIPFLASIGIEPSRPNFVWINKDVVNFATWMSTVAINLWMLGYTIKNKKKNKVVKIVTNDTHVNYRKYDLLLLGVFILFLGTVGSALFAGTYAGTSNWGGGAVYIYLILKNLIYLRLIYFFKDIPAKTSIRKIGTYLLKSKILVIIAVIYTSLFLFQGDRGPVLQIALVVAGSYVIFVKPIPFSRLVLFIIAGAFLFTIIRFGRGRDASEFDDGNIFQRGLSSYNESKDETNITDELASSVRIQYMALDIVPDQHPYMYGQMYLIQVVGIFPLMGSTLKNAFNIPTMYMGSANFFTILEQGINPSYGVGSEILADIYINFGLLGAFIIMFIFGMFISNVTNKAYQYNFIYIIVYIGLLYYSLYLNRSELLFPFKDIVYMLFINFSFTKIIK